LSDLLPAIKALEELEPAVEAFARATGVAGPARELAAWATDLIRYRRAPYQARLLMRAAAKIRASGLPPTAVEDKLLRAVLQDGPMEDDKDMQERWANLLANAAVRTAEVRIMFPRILSELSAGEASIIDRLASLAFDDHDKDLNEAVHELRLNEGIPAASLGGPGLAAVELSLDNLERLGLIRFDVSLYPAGREVQAHVYLTYLGWRFVRACREPPVRPPA
jgi:abortive infection alpha-like protein